MKSATVILTDIDQKTCRHLKGDLYVFDPELFSKLEVAKEAADRIRSLYLYDIDPQSIIWCREEVVRNRHALWNKISCYTWARIGTWFFRDDRFQDFCVRLLVDDYHQFLIGLIKLEYLHRKYKSICCITDEKHYLNDKFFRSLLPDNLRDIHDRTEFVVRNIAGAGAFRSLFIQAAGCIYTVLARVQIRRSGDHEKRLAAKYMIRLETGAARSYALNSKKKSDYFIFRNPTFLVDGKWITKEDAFFYLSAQDAKAIRTLKEHGFRVADQSGLRATISPRQWMSLLFSIFVTSLFTLNNGTRLLQNKLLSCYREYVSFTALVQRNKCCVHITQVDIPPLQIIRDMILKHYRVTTAIYQDAINWFMDDEVPSPMLVNMSFDHVFTVGSHFTAMYRKHTDNVGAYHELGLIRTARKWGQEENLPPVWNKFSCIDNDKNMVIAIFDESPITRDVELAMPNWKEIWNYLEDIFHFMDSETNIRFIFKPKHREKGSMGAALDCEIRTGLPFHSLREKMKGRSSVQVLDYRVDSVYAIMMADLVISPCFSTTGMEALALGKKSIYYDPQSIHKEHKYSLIDNLVAHGYDELKQLVSFWVHAGEKQRIDVIRCLKDEVVISNEDPIARFVNILSSETDS